MSDGILRWLQERGAEAGRPWAKVGMARTGSLALQRPRWRHLLTSGCACTWRFPGLHRVAVASKPEPAASFGGTIDERQSHPASQEIADAYMRRTPGTTRWTIAASSASGSGVNGPVPGPLATL